MFGHTPFSNRIYGQAVSSRIHRGQWFLALFLNAGLILTLATDALGRSESLPFRYRTIDRKQQVLAKRQDVQRVIDFQSLRWSVGVVSCRDPVVTVLDQRARVYTGDLLHVLLHQQMNSLPIDASKVDQHLRRLADKDNRSHLDRTIGPIAINGAKDQLERRNPVAAAEWMDVAIRTLGLTPSNISDSQLALATDIRDALNDGQQAHGLEVQGREGSWLASFDEKMSQQHQGRPAQTILDLSHQAPVPKASPVEKSWHGVSWVEDHDWLLDLAYQQDPQAENPAVQAHLEAEANYTDNVMAPTRRLQERLYHELRGRMDLSDQSVPEPMGEYEYYSRTNEGHQHPVYYRRLLDGGPEETLIDTNQLVRDNAPFYFRGMKVSPDGNRLIFSVNYSGADGSNLYLRDLRVGSSKNKKIAGQVDEFVWAADNHTVYWVELEPGTKRQYRVLRKRVDDDVPPQVVYQEDDPQSSVRVDISRDQEFILIHSGTCANKYRTSRGNEVRVVKADDPKGTARLVIGNKDNNEYQVDHYGDHFYITTNDKGPNFRLVAAPSDTTGEQDWTELIGHSNERRIADVQLFSDHYLLRSQRNGLTELHSARLGTADLKSIPMPDEAYEISDITNWDHDTSKARFKYSSFNTPDCVVEYDMEAQKWTTLKQREVPSGFDADLYEFKRIWTTARDGEQIPVSLIYRKDRAEADTQFWLEGYGAYDFAYPVFFDPDRLSLLDRGFGYAFAHIRGGGEMGKRWHDQGRLENKYNTFTDILDVADDLIDRGLTKPGDILLRGMSGGGLTVGAAINMRPGLFRAVSAEVPFVDVTNSMLNEDIPLTTGDFVEWGNPKIPEQFAWMWEYDPYQNVSRQSYPSIWMEAGRHDTRVGYWEPAKWAAKLRKMTLGNPAILYDINFHGGHTGTGERDKTLWQKARRIAFWLSQYGITD